MRKFLIIILTFFVIVAVVDFGIGRLGDYLQSHVRGGDTRRTNDLVMKDTHDVVILGSSRAHHHYDTPFLSDTLGLDIYNAGYDGNGVVLATGFLELILERYQPKLVLFDVEPTFDIIEFAGDNNHIRYIGNLKPYYRHTAIGNIIEDISTEEWYKVHSGMIRYNTNILTMLKECRQSIDTYMRGYAPLSGVYIKESNRIKEDYVIDDFKLKYIEKLILLAQAHNVPIVFVASPKYGRTSSDEIKPVIDICKRNNVTLLDYYSDSFFMQHKEWFKEPMHLNERGAKEFSIIIANVIKSYLNIE